MAMDDPKGRQRDAAQETAAAGAFAWTGIVVAALLVLFLVWWLPARVASGYAVPRITGSFASLPARLPVLWVRNWPWQTHPPDATVIFDLANGKQVSANATGSAPTVGWLSARAVLATLLLQDPPTVQPDQIVGIQVEWSGGRSFAAESALWVSAASGGIQAPGAKVVWADRMPASARVGIELPMAKNPHVIEISSPNPTLSPWLSAQCVAVPTGDGAGLRNALLRGDLPQQPQSCASLQSGEAVVLSAQLGKSYGFYVWQPVVQEVVNSHIRTMIAGPVQIGSVHPLTAQNWWRFTAAPPPPGF
ncbi:MAG: hypothetical protein M0Z66_02200 [Thermaerobacter sp.]|nr:hypothetical protein [Thermaerobacter sp.]